MQKKDIDIFFRTLAKHWPYPADILLTGGSAALLMGGSRPTEDIDFETKIASPKKKAELSFWAALQRTEQAIGVVAQFSESIERWSQITFLDYRNKATHYKTFGKIDVFILSPIHWSIGKVTRFWDQDIADMINVFKKTKPDPLQLAKTWRRALEKSPQSNAVFLTKQQMGYFFEKFGQKIWGTSLPKADILKILRQP